MLSAQPVLAVWVVAIGLAAGALAEQTAPPPAPCAGEAVEDDGSAESGYGFVPSSSEGTYVQRFQRAEFAHDRLAEVCVCWLKTRGDHDVDFEVVVYEGSDAGPVGEPLQRVAATATDVATTKETAGAFVAVPMGGVSLPAGTFYIGVRWNPQRDAYAFVCNDKTARPDHVPTPVFYRDDRSRRWSSAIGSADSNFIGHQAILVRATTSPHPTALANPASAAPTLTSGLEAPR